VFLTGQFFILFLAAFIFHAVFPSNRRWIVLLTFSYIFYYFVDPIFPVYLGALTIISYLLAKIESKSGKRKAVALTASILIPVSVLIFFKYLDFFSGIISDLIGISALKSSTGIILPVGISFYIFKILSYHIDLYNKRIGFEKHFGYYALYLSFFPQLLAGPIERAVNFIPELRKKYTFDEELFYSGVRMFLRGAVKKVVIADRLAVFVNEVFSTPQSYRGITLIITAIFFSFQIYCDFSGYSDIAIGLGRILGYRTKNNFNYPYFSKRISEFWGNWHISLSSWLRDYVFFPLSFSLMRIIDRFNLKNKTKDKIIYSISALITMFLAGLWHGANWTFVIWGVIIGTYLVFSILTAGIRKSFVKRLHLKKLKWFYNFWQILFTFILVSFSWIFFRSGSISASFEYINNFSFRFNGRGLGYIIISSFIILIFVSLEYISIKSEKFKIPGKIKPVFNVLVYCILICILIIFGVDSKNEFLYFNF